LGAERARDSEQEGERGLLLAVGGDWATSWPHLVASGLAVTGQGGQLEEGGMASIFPQFLLPKKLKR
jgi:hypothetical protein